MRCNNKSCDKKAGYRCGGHQCMTYYCSEKCQEDDWKELHQYECISLVVPEKKENFLQYIATNYIFGTKDNYTLHLTTGTLINNETNERTLVPSYALKNINDAFDISKFHIRDPEKDRPRCCDIPFVVYIYNDEYFAYPNQVLELNTIFQKAIKSENVLHQSKMRSMTSASKN